MFKKSFIDVAKRHFAKALKVPEDKVEELYDFVNTRFVISVASSKVVRPNKPETFSANLVYLGLDDGATSETLVVFRDRMLNEEFPSKEAALANARKKVNETVLYAHGNPLPSGVPLNVLMLFDWDYHKE